LSAFHLKSADAHAAFRVPKDLLAIVDEICIERDLTRSQLFRRSVAEYIQARGYQRDVTERQ
jgi:metal-responsive CopG/Arc/MetJ family transcriptional regulator